LYKGSYNHERSSYVEQNVTVEEIVHDNQDVECLPTIVSDYYGFEDHFSLDTNHEDQFYFSQRAIEISEGSLQQLSYLQTEGICNTHEELNLHKSFVFKLEQQEDCKYDSYLRQHLKVFFFSDLAMDRDIDHIGIHIPNHFEQEVVDDCIDNHIIKVDQNHNLLNPTIPSSYDHFYEEEIVICDDQEFLLKDQGGQLFFRKGECMHEKSFFSESV